MSLVTFSSVLALNDAQPILSLKGTLSHKEYNLDANTVLAVDDLRSYKQKRELTCPTTLTI